MLKMVRRHDITLALFAAGPTGLIAAISQLAKSAIDEQTTIQQKTLFGQAPPGDRHSNNLSESCYLVDVPTLGKGICCIYIARQDNRPIVAIPEVTAPDGYSGVIQLLVGIDFMGTVSGTWATKHHEMSGLGDKVELCLSGQTTHFSGKIIAAGNDSRWIMEKDGGGSNQFTGATIIPRVVVSAAKRVDLYMQALPAQLPQFNVCGE